jgi:DHA2 family multidrug resistance protein
MATFRAFQTVGLAFLFVPNSTLSYSSLPRSLNADATALYSMFRNISGSVGIAVITALGAERQQAHRAYLAQHLSPYDPSYQDLLTRHTQTLQAMGQTPANAHEAAMGLINQILNKQAAILSYMDLYAYVALGAFCLVPLTLLFRAGVAGSTGR